MVLERKLRDILKDVLSTGAKPEITYNETTSAGTAFIEIVPPNGEYVYMISATMSFGTDGDSVEGQALGVDGAWHTFMNPSGLADTSLIQGMPNLKMDYVNTAEIVAGDGKTITCRFVSRGSGPWRCQVLYYLSP